MPALTATQACTEIVAPRRQHLPVLDGVRGIAVLIVIGFHFWQDFHLEAHDWISRIAIWGSTGVDLFFVLSGFLITGILLDQRASPNSLRNFYVRRVLRIFPLYYATLIGVFTVFPLLTGSGSTPLRKSWWFWGYLQNIPATFAPLAVSGPAHFWSLAVEEQFYVVWPLLVLLLGRAGLWRAAWMAVVFSVSLRAVLVASGHHYLKLAMLDGLAIGSMLAIEGRNRPDGLVGFRQRARWLLIVLGPLLALCQLTVSGHGVALIQIFRTTLISIAYACFLILALSDGLGGFMGRLLCGRALGSAGKVSYAMYVLHPFVLNGLGRLGVRYSVTGLLTALATSYAAAWISWIVLEAHFLRLKRRFETA
jgi:peptidoglycan/LPS O-acetylase OafA/YrhL